jgi:hypothetical protein
MELRDFATPGDAAEESGESRKLQKATDDNEGQEQPLTAAATSVDAVPGLDPGIARNILLYFLYRRSGSR